MEPRMHSKPLGAETRLAESGFYCTSAAIRCNDSCPQLVRAVFLFFTRLHGSGGASREAQRGKEGQGAFQVPLHANEALTR
jgi:hypothetical protein